MNALKKIVASVLSFFIAFLELFGIGGNNKVHIIPIRNEVSDTLNIADEGAMTASIKYAYSAKNRVQCVYTDPGRTSYRMDNKNCSLTHSLTGCKKTATLCNPDGAVYIADSFDAFCVDTSGKKHSFGNSSGDARVNTIRLGIYLWECHVRDFERSGFLLDKAYHVYGDRLYQQFTILAREPSTDLSEFGSEIKIPMQNVEALEIRDKNGVHTSADGMNPSSVEYVAFDIRGAGIVGFIMPSDGSFSAIDVKAANGNYTVTQKAAYTSGTGINKYDETGGYTLNSVTFGCRVWTDTEHSFDGIRAAAQQERNPLEGVTVGAGNSGAEYAGYDALTGAYTFTMSGTHFGNAYNNPELQFSAPLSITGDGSDREIFLRANGESGGLEAAALLDAASSLLPIDVQVSKNFMGDGGEPYYSAIDYAYGDSYFPLYVKSGETLNLTLLNLYQNWGKVPLKQVSSIEFHTSYYHLSTGVTESNCIAPYFVYEKDGWTLPDFRCRSGNIWSDQPQFNSVGVLKFMTYNDMSKLFKKDKTVLSEYAGSIIRSTGLAYSDLTDYYVADSGAYKYSLRHVEFPQTDENRTYYALSIEFTQPVELSNFKRDFSLFYFDGRFVNFNKAGYLNANNSPVTVDIGKTGGNKYYTLGGNCPYFGFFDISDNTSDYLSKNFGCNFGLIVKNSSIVVGGAEQDIPFVFKDSSTAAKSSGSLTLDKDSISFDTGDTITVNMILLPWGTGTEETDSAVQSVREDSALSPVTLSASTGTAVEDSFVPTVRAAGNTAEFTVSGGKNNIAVKADGFTSFKAPKVYVLNGSEWNRVELASSNGYDGYTVRCADDGTYSFSFVFNSSGPEARHTFRIVGAQA